MLPKRLRDFPPVDLADFDVVQPDWLVGPCGLTNKSDPLTQANYHAVLDKLDEVDPYGKTWEEIRFPYQVGEVTSLDVVFVQPDSEAAAICKVLRDSLKEFPCLDVSLWEEFEKMPAAAK